MSIFILHIQHVQKFLPIGEKKLKTLHAPSKKSLHRLLGAVLLIVSGNLPVFASPLREAPGKVYVVLVGVQDYKKLQQVPYAVNDVEAVQEKLNKKFGFYITQKFDKSGKSGQMLVLSTGSKDEQHRPTSTNILETFNHLNDILRPQDTLIVYWAGHGQEFNNQQYLLTMDSDLANRPLRDQTSVRIESLKGSLHPGIVHRFLFFADTCRTDPDIKRGDTPNPLNANFARGTGALGKEIVKNGEYAILWACSSGQAAYPYTQESHGSFTYFLLQAMDQVKPLTMQALADSVKASVSKWSKKRAQDKGLEGKFEELQEPWLDSGGSGAIPLGESTSDMRVTLKVKASIPNAVIAVDGKVVKDGVYTADVAGIPGQKKRVKVVTRAPGYATDTQYVTLEAGEPQELPVDLEVAVIPNSLQPSGIGAGHIYTGAKPASPVRGDIWINPKDGAEMVYIPEGEFAMGSAEYSSAIFDDEKPVHKVNLSGYYIYRAPVTVKQYKQYCTETGTKMPKQPAFNPDWSKEDHPIVNVSWEDTQGYCKWAGVSLPTEAQWEKAARGSDGRKFPWGNTFDGALLQHSTKKFGDAGGTAPVGSFPSGASPYGVLDMAGNVCQWCSDWYGEDYYKRSPLSNPTGPLTGSARVLRGGSWDYNIGDYFRCACRYNLSPGDWYNYGGFRCAVPADSH